MRVKPSPAPSGVPQGSVLEQLLFLVYINNMPARVKSTTRLFADDSLFYRKIKSPEDAQAQKEEPYPGNIEHPWSPTSKCQDRKVPGHNICQ